MNRHLLAAAIPPLITTGCLISCEPHSGQLFSHVKRNVCFHVILDEWDEVQGYHQVVLLRGDKVTPQPRGADPDDITEESHMGILKEPDLMLQQGDGGVVLAHLHTELLVVVKDRKFWNLRKIKLLRCTPQCV